MLQRKLVLLLPEVDSRSLQVLLSLPVPRHSRVHSGDSSRRQEQHDDGHGGFKDGAAPETSPTAFKDDGKRRAVAHKVRLFGGEEVRSKALQELLSHLDVPVNAVTIGNKRDWFSTKKP